jgi:hypothetical protein
MELCETMHWVLDHLLELCHPICWEEFSWNSGWVKKANIERKVQS